MENIIFYTLIIFCACINISFLVFNILKSRKHPTLYKQIMNLQEISEYIEYQQSEIDRLSKEIDRLSKEKNDLNKEIEESKERIIKLTNKLNDLKGD